MDYKKIKNDDDNNNNDDKFDKNIKLINKSNDDEERLEKEKLEKLFKSKNNKENILIITLLIIFLFLILIYQNILSNYTKTWKNNSIAEENKNASKTDGNIKTEDNIKKNEIITEENVPLPRNIYKIETFPSIDESFEKAKNFLENNLKGILLRNISSLSIQNPIATGIIPIYNSKNYISRAIKSIQNQNILNIEIILVDDKSTDDTLSFIKEIQKEDQRIKIISNKKNMGILYSRSIGALSAKGKYIFVLDNDDMFLDKDVFQTITKIAEKGIFDIVEFKGIESTKGENDDILKNSIRDTKWEYHPLNLVLYQPALGNYPTWRGRKINTIHLETVYLCKMHKN